MLIGIAVFRITEIPATVVPESIRDTGSAMNAEGGQSAGSSLFVAAMQTVTSGPPLSDRAYGTTILPNGWRFATPAEKAWVEAKCTGGEVVL